MRRILALLVVAAPAGCVTISSSSIGTFAGVLPCADCSGIFTELRLYAERPSGRPTHYDLTETYMGTREGDRSVARTGAWATLRGSASDRDATLIQLDLGSPSTLRNFLRLGENELRRLDLERREIPVQAPHSLHRVSELPAVTLLDADSGRTLEVERGQRVFVVLGANRSTGYDWILEGSAPGPLSSLGGPVYAQNATIAGAGGTAIWFFGATRPGEQELVFRYRRPSESGVPAARTLRYTISVR